MYNFDYDDDFQEREYEKVKKITEKKSCINYFPYIVKNEKKIIIPNNLKFSNNYEDYVKYLEYKEKFKKRVKNI
jgi:hypothetical protein